ncbi:hypothetical protein [Nocardioides daphniae]|uniref:Uncharacterized protein n=1 Tax=Nocardioides daphniae TaxID=402297 RepID=A0A4P7UCF8_9ACTN|nr:hypothetical protein [Nocardioides daphniae]QCC77893.1 hypothetical protein E2C04_13140 [Nocardioides daphniae]
MPSQDVPVVTLSDVDVTAAGLVVTPDYAGHVVEGTVPQKRTGEHWGAFPQEFVTFLEPMGTDQFWYSTGLQSDWTKLPTPIRVAVAGTTVKEPPPAPKPERADPTNAVTLPPAPTGPVAAPALPGQVPMADLPAVGAPDPTSYGTSLGPVSVEAAAAVDDVRLASARASHTPWVVGGVLLLGAALLLLVPVRGRVAR